MESPQAVNSKYKLRLSLLLGFCSIAFFVANVATPSCFDSPVPAMVLTGVLTTQLTLICVWGTLVRGTFWIRLTWTLLLIVPSWCGLAWAISIEHGGPQPTRMLAMGVTLGFGFATSFVPLKVAALCFQWTIVREFPNRYGSGQTSNNAIRDILIGTMLLALSVGIGRWMSSGSDSILANVNGASGPLNDRALLVLLSIYGVVSLIVKRNHSPSPVRVARLTIR